MVLLNFPCCRMDNGTWANMRDPQGNRQVWSYLMPRMLFDDFQPRISRGLLFTLNTAIDMAYGQRSTVSAACAMYTRVNIVIKQIVASARAFVSCSCGTPVCNDACTLDRARDMSLLINAESSSLRIKKTTNSDCVDRMVRAS